MTKNRTLLKKAGALAAGLVLFGAAAISLAPALRANHIPTLTLSQSTVGASGGPVTLTVDLHTQNETTDDTISFSAWMAEPGLSFESPDFLFIDAAPASADLSADGTPAQVQFTFDFMDLTTHRPGYANSAANYDIPYHIIGTARDMSDWPGETDPIFGDDTGGLYMKMDVVQNPSAPVVLGAVSCGNPSPQVGDPITLVAEITSVPNPTVVHYTWQVSTDGGSTWQSVTGDMWPSVRYPDEPLTYTPHVLHGQ